eukprot:m.853064 g.853064  ORF g.853064 m.853064 type:complete len:105 (-) comp59606_c0_seq3:25-339(-)
MALSCVRLMFRIASKISLESGFHRGLLMLARRESAGACIDWGRRATDLASAVTRCITLPQPSIATCSVVRCLFFSLSPFFSRLWRPDRESLQPRRSVLFRVEVL